MYSVVEKEVFSVSEELALAMCFIGESEMGHDVRYAACRIILRLYSSHLTVISSVTRTQSASQFDFREIPEVLLRTVKVIYELLHEERKDSNRSASAAATGGGSSEVRRSLDLVEIMSMNAAKPKVSSTLSSSASGTVAKNVVLGGGGDVELLLDLQSIVWDCMPRYLQNKIELIEGAENARPRSAAVGNEPFLDLLQAMVVTAGIIKLHSSEEIGRRRLSHMNAVDSICVGLRCMGSAANTCLTYMGRVKDVAMSRPGTASGDAFGRPDLTTTTRTTIAPTSDRARVAKMRLVLDKLNQILVQLVAALRNFTLDSVGRNQLLSCKAVCLLCSLMRPFKTYPDLLLNCAR